ncbi:MAG: hypothetical protein GY862_14345 [Gammaproteobacteria bacterium]|nr:hypothetical protein [Gammaproteobacteria bacterium]
MSTCIRGLVVFLGIACASSAQTADKVQVSSAQAADDVQITFEECFPKGVCKKGQLLKENINLDIPENGKVTVRVSATGMQHTKKGPYADKKARDMNLKTWWETLMTVFSYKSENTSAELRTINLLRIIDIKDAHFCFNKAKGLELRRADTSSMRRLELEDKSGRKARVEWRSGEERAPWPATLPVENLSKYRLKTKDIHDLVFHQHPGDIDDSYLDNWMRKEKCMRQVEASGELKK